MLKFLTIGIAFLLQIENK